MAQYSIEIAGKRNDNVVFPPVSQLLRGAWDIANTAHLNMVNGPGGDWLRDLTTRVRRIPGLVVVVDSDKKKAAILDPLGLPENTELLKTMNLVFKTHGRPFDSNGCRPQDTQEYTLDFDGVKLWLYWMRRLLNGNLAVLCAGSPDLPSLEECDKLPGRRRADPMNIYEQSAESPALAKKGEFGLYPWVAEVPIPKSAQAATA